jgi:hypothetical protein
LGRRERDTVTAPAQTQAILQKLRIIMSQVAGSGTAAVTVAAGSVENVPLATARKVRRALVGVPHVGPAYSVGLTALSPILKSLSFTPAKLRKSEV